jgi:hypothetical protein
MAPPSLLAHLDSSKDASALSLAYASVGDDGCNAIARFVRENVMLRTIDLRGNNIRADGLVVLAHSLRSNSSIVSVCLKWNQVGSHTRGVQALCDVLKDNQSITNLDLRNNKIPSDCGIYFSEMLRENSSLTHLDLSWNELGPEGGKALLEGIQANRSLIDCQLSGNRITEDTLHAIAFILRRNRQTAPMAAAVYRQDAPEAVVSSPTSPMTSRRNVDRSSPMHTDRSYGGTPALDATDRGITLPPITTVKAMPPVQNEELSLKLLQREQHHGNAEDARFFGEVAEYIDLLQLDVARNKKYRMDAEERERVVTKGFMEREMRYAQEMRELENLLAKAKAERDELLHDSQYLQCEIDRVREETTKTVQDRERLEQIATATADRLRADIRDALTIKADLETQIYKVKRRQQEQEEENARLRTYLSKCKDDLDRALK